MAITARRSDGGSFQQAPDGSHIARCYSAIDLGTQHGEYQNKPTVRRQVLIGWELPNVMVETTDGPKPAIISKFYTLVLSDKSTLQADLQGWRGKAFTEAEKDAFDITVLIGKACLLSVVQDEKGRARVHSIMRLPQGVKCPPPFNPPFVFSFEDYDDNAFESLPEGIRRIVGQSDEYKELHMGKPGGPPVMPKPEGVDHDDIPF